MGVPHFFLRGRWPSRRHLEVFFLSATITQLTRYHHPEILHIFKSYLLKLAVPIIFEPFSAWAQLVCVWRANPCSQHILLGFGNQHRREGQLKNFSLKNKIMLFLLYEWAKVFLFTFLGRQVQESINRTWNNCNF